jgi:hypothetical protein
MEERSEEEGREEKEREEMRRTDYREGMRSEMASGKVMDRREENLFHTVKHDISRSNWYLFLWYL